MHIFAHNCDEAQIFAHIFAQIFVSADICANICKKNRKSGKITNIFYYIEIFVQIFVNNHKYVNMQISHFYFFQIAFHNFYKYKPFCLSKTFLKETPSERRSI